MILQLLNVLNHRITGLRRFYLRKIVITLFFRCVILLILFGMIKKKPYQYSYVVKALS